ncbi:MAG: hypothetical protein WC208_08640 [Gallionella sp.]|jgi:hypothetical protein
MQVTIDIDDGGKARKALPIRAIPYVCAWSYDAAPDDIVQTLAAPKIKKYYGLAIRLRHNELFAYQKDAQGKCEQIPPSQWEPIADTLKSLATKLQADEREDAEDENRATWKIKAVLELPDNVFIWLDEFQHWYSSTRPIDPESADVEHVAPEDEDEDAGRLTKLDDTLCLSPLIPSEIENKLWRYPKDFVAATPDGLHEHIGKPWLVASPNDPTPDFPWYTPARYFARQLVKDDSTLLTKRKLLSEKVEQSMKNAGIKKRGGKKPHSATTILKAFANVTLG